MKTITEFLSTKVAKPSIIKATDETIKQIVKAELDRLGYDANLNHIDVSEVTYMVNLFNCDKYNLGLKYVDLNPDISKWNTRNVTEMGDMFSDCKKFNCDISEWDVSSVENMSGMFYNCQKFNQDITQWKVNNVKNMYYMFWNCKKFNQDLSEWDVDNVINWDSMFVDCPIKQEYKPKFSNLS